MKGAIHSKALREAARRVEENMLKAWDAEDGSGHVFSPSFDLRMEPLLTSARRREQRLRAAQAFAASFAIVLLCAFTWLASHAAARNAVQKWVRETWRNTVVYRFTDTREAALPNYRPTWLPEGYKETEVFETNTYCVVTYQNDQGSCIFFRYQLMKDGSDFGLAFLSQEEYQHQIVSINGMLGELYICISGNEENDLLWMDENAGFLFGIDAKMSDSVILNIAESVSMLKQQNQ